jgi:replication factor C small subunit
VRKSKWKNIIHKTVSIQKENKKETVYGFVLDTPSQWYITNDYIITHNTGKSSCAKAIAKELDCDVKYLNSSLERGIEVVRDEVRLFAQSMSSKEGTKRLVFMDEADGVTSTAQNSLRNMMEEYSSNCFFILTCNDLNKIIEPIRSRCVIINFERPNKREIVSRLEYICSQEKIEADIEDISKLVDKLYPDIRSMILTLQSCKLDNKPLLVDYNEYNEFIKAIKLKDVQTIYSKVFGGSFDILSFNRFFFNHLMENYDKYQVKTKEIALCLAEVEKYWNLGSNINIIFISEMLKVSDILDRS